MRTLALLAASAAALAIPAGSASASCTYYGQTPGTNVSVCKERVWEKQRITIGCSIDTNGDGQADAACKPIVVEYYG